MPGRREPPIMSGDTGQRFTGSLWIKCHQEVVICLQRNWKEPRTLPVRVYVKWFYKQDFEPMGPAISTDLHVVELHTFALVCNSWLDSRSGVCFPMKVSGISCFVLKWTRPGSIFMWGVQIPIWLFCTQICFCNPLFIPLPSEFKTEPICLPMASIWF